ncbi:MAG: GNAT family N-acetyltransferase [Ruminococcus sp.]|nr:GNAT family N-acetyltransferase [Ruminococcus sp.]
MFLIETERLTITEFTPDMAQAVHENSLDEDNRRFVPDEVFETVDEAAETIEFLMSQYGGSDGPFVYPVLIKDGANIGYVQAIPLDDGFWEIGFHVGEKYTKNGYATEAVKAFLPVIMNKLGIEKIKGICLSENIASRKVMEKCDFVLEFEGTDSYQGDQRQICRYWFTN